MAQRHREIRERQTRWPVYAAAAASLCAIGATTWYALLGFAGRVPVTLAHYFAGNALYVLINGLLGYLLWQRRHLFSFTAKAFAIAWAGIYAWWSLPQPLFLVLTISPDSLQTKWLFFTWMWEIPIIGGFLFGGFVIWLLRPITAYVAGLPAGMAGRGRADAASLYAYTLHYPLVVASSLVGFATLGYFLGALQSRYFGTLPFIEAAKVFGQGFVSSLFMAIFYYFAFHWYLRDVRRRLEHAAPGPKAVRGHFARRVFTVTSIITLGSLLYTSFIVLQVLQRQLNDNLTAQMQHIINRAHDELTRARTSPRSDYDALLRANLTALQLGQRGWAALLAETKATMPELAPATQQFVSDQDVGLTIDSRNEHKLVAVWTEPRDQQKILTVTYVSDFYSGLQTHMFQFAVVGGFVSLLSILTTTIASTMLAGALRALTQAVRRAQRKPARFTFDTGTADELEDLAHAFAYYINQANEKTAALAAAVERLQEIDRLKTEFVSIASHQLRTPLTGIRWAYHALLEEDQGPLNQQQRALVQGGLDRAALMIKLVNELLNVSRIEHQTLELNTAATSLPALINAAADNLRPLVLKRRINLRVHLPAAPLPDLKLDAEKMSIVINNLLDNALKYTSPGGDVTLALVAAPRGVRFTITDTGIGIPTADKPRLFTRFFRAANAVLMHPNGTGLGLYIVKSIVEKHGGHISAVSHEGRGSTFTVFLPKS